MGLLRDLFRTDTSDAALLISIGTHSVRGAYVLFAPGKLPVFIYVKQILIAQRPKEPLEKAMLRALEQLGDTLVREGARVVSRTIGHGHILSALVTVDAPWQETRLSTSRLKHAESLNLTKEVIASAIHKAVPDSAEKTVVDESVIATSVDGYYTRNPFNKKVRNASIEAVVSVLDTDTLRKITSVFKRHYHAHNVRYVSGPSLRYQTLSLLFPHEKDVMILDSSKEEVSVLLIRKGMLVTVAEAGERSLPGKSWKEKVAKCFESAAKQFPLPRTLLLVARDREVVDLKEAIENETFETLRFWDNSLKTVPLLRSQITPYLVCDSDAADLSMLLMGLYYHHHHLGK